MGETVRAFWPTIPTTARATYLSPTIRIVAARTCRTSPSSRRCIDAAGRQLLFFTASRAHHAEIGGIRAGLDAPVFAEPGRRRRADSQFQTSRCRAVATRRVWAIAHSGALSHAQGGRQPGRCHGTSGRQSAGSARPARDSSSGTRCRWCEAYMRHIQDAAERKMRPALARAARRPAPIHRSSG